MKNKTFFALFHVVIIGALCWGMERPSTTIISSFEPLLEYVKATRKLGALVLFDYDDTIHNSGILTDQKLPQVISELIECGYKVGILTARRPGSIRHIQDLLCAHHIILNLCEGSEFKLGEHSLFLQGVIAAGSDAKGIKASMLLKFFECSKIVPSEVIVIDDKQKHVHSIQDMCAQCQYPFKGFVFRKKQ